jgi:hypothetical protein|tara:strand:+ start:91 stop:318 length:228 start_codon:yes stop_codon:yes gene_type:complete
MNVRERLGYCGVNRNCVQSLKTIVITFQIASASLFLLSSEDSRILNAINVLIVCFVIMQIECLNRSGEFIVQYSP